MSQTLISVSDARRAVLDATGRLDPEPVQIAAALGRVLAEDVRSKGPVPPFACSAMDGYAIEAGDARVLTVIGESRAGQVFEGSLGPGEAVRISTGAAVPTGATAVIRQEDVRAQDGRIETTVAIEQGENVRAAGEDMPAGTTVLRAGTVLGVAELGAAVAAGVGSVRAARQPRVAVFCTGDELRAPGEPLGPGEIHNSNAPMLIALARRCGGVAAEDLEATAAGAARLPDDREATIDALGRALDLADVVVVSGGVSVGPHDHVKPALEALGVEEIFWGVALQPGKPTWFGRKGERLVFGLPGNPVSAFVTFTLFARPALLALQGAEPPTPIPARTTLATPVRRNPNREQALRVRLEQRGEAMVAIPNGPQGSHMVTSLLAADALAMIPAGAGELPAGTVVELQELPR